MSELASNSSSGGVDNSAAEVATPSRTTIIIPAGRVAGIEVRNGEVVITLRGADR